MTIRIAASASRSARNGHSSVLRSGHRIAVEIVVPPARAIELRRSSRSGPHRNKTSAGARIAASDPGVMSGASAQLRSRSRRLSPSRFSLRPRHSVRSLGARRLQADLKVSHGSSVRLRHLGKQSLRDGRMLVVVRPRVVRKVSPSSSAKSRRNAMSVAMTMDGAVAALIPIRRDPGSRINLASVATLGLIAEGPRASAMGVRRKGRRALVVAMGSERAAGSVRHVRGLSGLTRSRRAASSASKVADA